MKTAKKAAVIGAGFIGIEMLEAFIKNKMEVTIIEKADRILPIMDPEFSELIKEHILVFDAPCINIVTNNSVEAFKGEGKLEKVITANGLEFDADICILSVGVRPNVKIAKDAGIEIGPTGAIKVDRFMKTSVDNIYAAGDCCEKNHMVTHTPTWTALGSIANKEGRVAAINISGGNEAFEGVLGSYVTRYFGFTISMTGLTEEEARRSGIETLSATVTKYDKAGYMPSVNNITIKLIINKQTQELIGAQAIGCGDADKRISSVSSALLGSMTLPEFLNLDLTYAPPFSTPIDPLLNAAWQLDSKLNQ